MLRKPYAYLILFVGLLSAGSVNAQEYSFRHYVGAELKTNGFGLTYDQIRFSKNKRIHKTFSSGLSSLKHAKEIKIVNPNASNPTPFVFGKLNRVGLVHASPGLRYDVIPRHGANNLGLSFSLNVGPQLAVLKPVFLRINHNNQANDGVFVANERYNPEVHTDQTVIEGYSRSKYGWGQLDYQLGLQANPAVQVEWGKDQINSKAVVIGSRFDLFLNPLPIMANKAASQNFGAFYVQFKWGFIKL